MHFQVRRHGTQLGEVELPLPGRHNVQNALAALAVSLEVGISFPVAAAALEAFGGVERRFETVGSAAGVRVVDDYGHHPTEIRATLAAARDLHSGRIVAVFQPHRYTRTRDLMDDFATAFHDADRVVLTEIYAAGEEKLPGVDAATLAEAIRARGHRDVELAPDLTGLPARLAADLRTGDLVITLGAGSITQVGPALLRELTAQRPER
jgi:UDP-N-acetylmuramate--alanine ligase